MQTDYFYTRFYIEINLNVSPGLIVNEVREAIKTLLTPHYKGPNLPEELTDPNEKDIEKTKVFPTYCVIFKARLNQNFFKQDAIDVVGEIMKDFCPSAKVDYKNPDLSIIFEVMKSYCCLSVLPNYFKYKKYNLLELAGEISTPVTKEAVEIKPIKN